MAGRIVRMIDHPILYIVIMIKNVLNLNLKKEMDLSVGVFDVFKYSAAYVRDKLALHQGQN